MKVLITDSGYKHALGAARSLGRNGIYVIAGATNRYAPTFFSKYCRERLIYPHPRDSDGFANFILNYVKKKKIDVVLPIGYLTSTALSKHKSEISGYTILPIADWKSMEIAANKDKTLELAEGLRIRVPRIFRNIAEIKNFPIVAKRIKESGYVRYINSFDELDRSGLSDSILQEYIPGNGYGFFALLNHGNLRAFFMHKRLREYPITGGPSTAAESIYDPKLKEMSLRLLKALNWHGVAMVEFKKDNRDGEYKLMEINPKFWGSLDLAIASGVDFPYLAVKMATDGDVDQISDYRIGLKFRWPFPDDFLHLLARPNSFGRFIGDFFTKNTADNIWLSDIKPNLFQMMITLPIVIKNIKNIKYPHGFVKL